MKKISNVILSIIGMSIVLSIIIFLYIMIKNPLPIEKNSGNKINIREIIDQLTEEQKQCGIEKLGKDRVDELLLGSEPTTFEIIKLSPCV